MRVGPDTVRGPDVSFLSSSRWGEVEERLADYFAAGTRIAWVIDPQQHRVIVRYPERAPRVLAHGSVLEGEDVLPGFRLPLTDLFVSR